MLSAYDDEPYFSSTTTTVVEIYSIALRPRMKPELQDSTDPMADTKASKSELFYPAIKVALSFPKRSIPKKKSKVITVSRR